MEIKSNINLSDKNWFKTGGTAKYYIAPKNNDDFKNALLYAKNNNLDIFVIGKGANILISDDGFDGLVINPKINSAYHEEYDEKHSVVHAGAGLSLQDLISYCLDNNLLGLEEFSGIPGTIGGSTYINIHYFSFYLSHFLINGTIINKKTLKIETVDNQWFNFGYDQSKLLQKEHYLLQASFKLKKANIEQTAYARGRREEIIKHRNARYPNSHTCGSFFRNFFDHEVTQTIADTNKKMIYVAYYLDKLGIKGCLKKGGAIVSHKHANMIVNQKNATSHDIIDLAKEMQLLVKEHFSITPQPECQLVGFKNYPLLQC